ncbi:putative glucose-6-phosphate translocase-like [Apostichopus japonicus]|uniref:Putative glucose-6-phosphate translocase-like n=1 Tax=Stichopus japonicus TaxID=307972 RepID=A0A2G8KAI9_STIJA|nr:putative glucose-6-phosphate translocase-like [Apostichopus japonicus]
MRSIIRQDETASALDERTDRGGDPDRPVCQFLLGGRVRGHLVPQRLGQGCGWPPCTKLLKQWYLPSQLGTWWSLLSASSNLSGAAGPLVLTLAAHHLGWRSVMTLTGCSCVMLSFFSYTFIKNSPSDVGSPPILKDTDSEDGDGEMPTGSQQRMESRIERIQSARKGRKR